MERTITVRGVGNISAKPDFIVIEMYIRGQSKNYSEATRFCRIQLFVQYEPVVRF